MINGETLKQSIISGANNILSIKARINDLSPYRTAIPEQICL